MRRRLLPALLLAVTLLLAGCNGTPDVGSDVSEAPTGPTEAVTEARSNDPEALQHVADAAAATAEQRTVRFEVTLETEGTGGEDGVQPLSASGEEDFESQQRTITFQGPSGELQSVVDGTDIYVELPGTEDDTWARVELESLIAGENGFGGPGGLPFRSSEDNLRLLAESVTSAAAAGEEEVRGTSTTRYDLVVDLTAAAQNAAEANDTAAAIAEQSGVTELAMSVWIDEEDLIRRVAYSLDLGQANVDAATEVDAQPAGATIVTLEYFDFGSSLTIEPPTDDQIVDIDEDEIRNSMRPDELNASEATS